MTGGLSFVRKGDWKCRLVLRPDDPVAADELADATYRLKPSFKHPQLILEIYQPVVGQVHKTILGMCEAGIEECGVYTTISGRPDLHDKEMCGHLAYLYQNGEVIDQQTHMSKDVIDADEFMVHIVCLAFKKARILTNTFDLMTRPAFSLVQDTGQVVTAAR